MTKITLFFILLSTVAAAIGGCESDDIATYKKMRQNYPDISADDIATYKTMQQNYPNKSIKEFYDRWESESQRKDQNQENTKTPESSSKYIEKLHSRFLMLDEDDHPPQEIVDTSDMRKKRTTYQKKTVTFDLSKNQELHYLKDSNTEERKYSLNDLNIRNEGIAFKQRKEIGDEALED